jgi:hypothetical protein
MMAVLESNTGQTRPNTGINTEAPEIEGWKRRKGETASSITQGGQDTLELEGTRDAEAKGFATMIEAPEADNKVTATTGDTKTDLQDMEGGSGTTAIDSGKIEKDKLGSSLINQKYKVLETKSAKGANSEWANRGYDKPPVKPDTIVYVVEAGNNEYVRLFNRNDDGESNMIGRWVMRKKDIEGLSLEQIKDKYALPVIPKYICDVHIPSDINLEVSYANGLEDWGIGGGVQFDTMDVQLEPEWFVNPRKFQ